MNDRPPGPPEVTDYDRAKLRENITTLCRKNNVSQRQLEADANFSNGFLSKLWKGKVHFTLDVLLKVCKRFACEPVEIVHGSAYTYLLDTAPPSAESDAVRLLREERDAASERAATAEAEASPLREAAATALQALEAAEVRAAAAEARCAELAAEVRAAAAGRDQQAGEAKAAREEAARVHSEATKASARVVAARYEEQQAKTALAELRRHLEEWKTWASTRDARANFLERQLAALQIEYQKVLQNANLARNRAQQLEAQLSNTQGATVGGGLLGLAAGLLIAAAGARDE